MNRAAERSRLIGSLNDCVKQCQVRFGGRSELATELDARIVALCSSLENALSHGLKDNRNLLKITREMVLKGLPKSVLNNIGSNREVTTERITFWHFVRLFLTKHEYERFLVLKNIHTDIGRGRAWLRSALNENSLERYLLMIIDDVISIRPQFYEDWALMMNGETNSILSSAARGLSPILFAINIDNPELNASTLDSLIIEPKLLSEPVPVVVNPNESRKLPLRTRDKVRPPRMVSLGDDDASSDRLSVCSAQSAPPTCNSSPESTAKGSNRWLSSDSYNSETEVNDAVNTNLILTPVGEDNVSVGELALPSENEDGNPSPESGLQIDRLNLSTTSLNFGRALTEDVGNGLLETMRRQREEYEKIKAELALSKSKFDETQRKSAAVIDSLTKENNMMKVQLKKYISAITLLKQQESRTDHEDQVANEAKEGEISLASYNHYQEVNEYEKKLVQVAEMHGELVEFNDRLHRVILQKEAIIRRLREELIDVRGPIGLDQDIADDDNISIASDPSTVMSHNNSLNRPLISVWIPTAFMAGQPKSNSHHVYQVYIRVKDEEWNVYRRYSQFYGLHKQLKKAYPLIRTLDFPPKKAIGNRDARTVQERRKKLEHYLRCVINTLQAEHNIADKRNLIEYVPFLGDRRVQTNRGSRSDSSGTEQATAPLEQQHYAGL